MMYEKKGMKVNKNTKGYSALSILEKGVYTNKPNYYIANSDHSILETKIYNNTVHERIGLWQRIQMILDKFLPL